jgi:DNA-binding response OmpR family regulator
VTQDAESSRLAAEPDSDGFVLVVDDDEDVREAVAAFLKENGFRVLVAEGGMQAITVMSGRETRPSLVLLDWNMPGVGGPEVIDWMACEQRGLPVYVFTASPHQVTATVPVLKKWDMAAVLEAVRGCCSPAACPA